MKKIKKLLLFIIILIFINYFSISIISQNISGLVEVIDPALNGKKLSSGSIYNPDENSCITTRYNMLTVLLLENIINGKKTIVYVIDNNPNFKFKDSLLAISSRAAKELGESSNVQIAVKITVLKEGTTVQAGTSNTQTQQSDQTDTQTTDQIQIQQTNQATQVVDQSQISSVIPILTAGKNTSTTYYYVQVGAFKNKDNAIVIAQKLKNLGYRVFIYYNQLYKVIVGPYKKYEEAVEVKKILTNIVTGDQPFIFSSTVYFE